MPAPVDIAELAALNRAHDDLDELLRLHQECLIAGALSTARALFGAYRELLELHMAHEETWVLPIYARAKPDRWPAELFLGQHAKLRALVARVEPALAECDAGVGWRRQVLEVLKREVTLEHLLEHHHLAEDQALYPIAATHATAGERAAIATRCTDEWASAMERYQVTIDNARATLAQE